jgi:hypothetical protein
VRGAAAATRTIGGAVGKKAVEGVIFAAESVVEAAVIGAAAWAA